MNIQKCYIILISIIFLINSATPLNAIHADVEDLSGSKYLPKTLELLSQAKESIYIVMYLITIIPGQTDSPSYKLLRELINAHKRGVKVTVILDYRKSGKYEEGQTSYYAYNLLKDAGINVHFDIPNIYTHNKTIIIDKNITITGSANWSTSALTENNETNLLIKSHELAQILLEQLYNIQLLTPYNQDFIPVKVPYKILSQKGPIQEMLRRNDHRIFDTYLLLLYLNQINQEITYETLSKWLNLKGNHISTRRAINHSLRTLARTYKLIEFTPKFNKPFQLKLLNPENPALPYLPLENCFNLPNQYWEYRWHKRLNLNNKALLLINLAELGKKPIGLEWQFSRKKISKKYDISEWTISMALKGLKTYNIIEIEYSDIKTDYEHRASSKIKFLGLYDWDLLQEQLNTLESTHGKKKYKKAQSYASIIYKQNDAEKIEEIIKLMDDYGEELVEEAFKIISLKAPDNPKRSFKYVIGILRKMKPGRSI